MAQRFDSISCCPPSPSSSSADLLPARVAQAFAKAKTNCLFDMHLISIRAKLIENFAGHMCAPSPGRSTPCPAPVHDQIMLHLQFHSLPLATGHLPLAACSLPFHKLLRGLISHPVACQPGLPSWPMLCPFWHLKQIVVVR